MAAIGNVGSIRFIPPGEALDRAVRLDDIRGARGDINEIRFLLKGNAEACCKLFREAVAERDAIAQIQLSQAFAGIEQGKDHEKDFSSLEARDLERFSYYPREFDLFNSIYDKAMGVKSDRERRKARGEETFGLAADQGYLPAVLELTATKWKWNMGSYGFAVQLRPFVGKGDVELDYYFGQALKNGCQRGSKLYYEGLHWMDRSGGIIVKYPKKGESFESFSRCYLEVKARSSGYCQYDGFIYVGPVILAPSEEAWETFRRERLAHVEIAPLESYQFKYDAEQIVSLVNQYKISTVHGGSFVEHPTMGGPIVGGGGRPMHGFSIDTLSVYEDLKQIGDISVREDTFELYKTIENPKIEPVIKFIENIVIRTGSVSSVSRWLRQMGSRY